MPNMTVSFSHCCRRLKSAFVVLALLAAVTVRAGSIEPQRANLTPGDEGYMLSAEFSIDLGMRLEDAVTRGVPLYFNLEFVLERSRKYWLSEHIATRNLTYRLAYSTLTRQYRLSNGNLHRSFDNLTDALRAMGRIAGLPIGEKEIIKPGQSYQAALRLTLDRSQLPKPFQVDAITDREWQVDARVLRWNYTAPGSGS